ncbi:hypothetical protein [uncultured Litoreibacter sp.]|uniref:hypothetical protein n=1 Tax=uncultured Litoreibacter sp. TaxID=1392394 RepID=UPI002632EF6B|nr:hypothetical protein [uncultured Litoreibacter sp.]
MFGTARRRRCGEELIHVHFAGKDEEGIAGTISEILILAFFALGEAADMILSGDNHGQDIFAVTDSLEFFNLG